VTCKRKTILQIVRSDSYFSRDYLQNRFTFVYFGTRDEIPLFSNHSVLSVLFTSKLGKSRVVILSLVFIRYITATYYK